MRVRTGRCEPRKIGGRSGVGGRRGKCMGEGCRNRGKLCNSASYFVIEKGLKGTKLRKIREERGMQSSCTLYERWDVWTPL